MEEIVRAEGRGLEQDEGVGSGTEVTGIGNRRGGAIGEGHGNDWR